MATKTKKPAPTTDPNAAPEDKTPDFEIKARITQYHEIEPSERLPGFRIQFRGIRPQLKPDDNKHLPKKTRYGLLQCSYFPSEDHAAKMAWRGRLEMTDYPPENKDTPGERLLNFYPGSPMTAQHIQEVLEMKHRGDAKGEDGTVNESAFMTVAFWGSYNQQDMFAPGSDDEGDEEEDQDE